MNTYKVIGQKISNGGLVIYSISLPIVDALKVLEIPDPGRPFPGNRRVNKKHAMEFGNYWEREPGNWMVPPILIDSEETIRAEVVVASGLDGSFFELELPVESFGILKILDGQHRILGWYLKFLELDVRRADTTTTFNRAIVAGNEKLAQEATHEIQMIAEVSDRLASERISINIIDSLDERRHQQFFVDIAKNALGINKTVQAKFDNSSVINRVAQFLIKTHPLLVDNVDLEKTTCSGTNENLLSVVNVADVVRHVCFGISSRVTARREVTYDDDSVMAIAKSFFDVMQSSLPAVENMSQKSLSAVSLRQTSLLGSGTIWRCFAGAYFEICVKSDDATGELALSKIGLSRFRTLLSLLEDDLGLPISERWLRTGLFPNENSKAPSSRAQDLSAMVEVLDSWSREAVNA